MDAVVVLLMAVVVIAVVGLTRAGWIASAVAAVGMLVLLGLTTWFVFGEDTYVQDGASRWDTRGSGPHDLYVTAMVVGGILGALYGTIAIRRSRGPLVSVALVVGGILEAFGLFVVALAFGSN